VDRLRHSGSRRLTAAVLALALTAVPYARTAEAAALDPRLLPIVGGERGPDLISRAVVGVAPSAPADALIGVSLRVSGPVPDLSSLGVRIGAVLGDVVTADVPVSQLPALAAHPSIRSITASRPLTSFLDASVPATKAPQVWSLASRVPPIEWSGHTGRGVLIGIIDTGLDTTHKDFLRPDGATRVLAAWDQSSAVGRPPLGFSYGAECRAAQIDARQCPLVDRVGHGTHVAGIAAGNGSATGADRPAYQYVGVAPEADLLVVKLGEQTSNRVIDALAYLKATASAMGRPLVANLSLGTSSGAHDGTSDFERAIDAFTGPGDSPAAVVVVAGGNYGAATIPIHAGGTVSASPLTVGFVVPGGATRVEIDLWYPGAAQLGVSVTTPSCGATPKSSPSPSGTPVVAVSTACGEITISSGEIDVDNGDRETVAILTSATGLAVGVWSLTLTGEDIPSGPAAFDAWSVADEGSPVATFIAPFADPGKTLAVPATATEAISVVHWVTKTRWTSLVGDREYRGETIGALATTAGRGPRRTCSLPSACPTVAKPDLAAPGVGVKSSLSSRIDEAPFETATSTIDDVTDPDRVHFIQQGSSMAAPHVAGAAALVLQINPALTAAEVKALLKASAQPPAVPAPTQWGAGKLDAQKATDPLSLTDPKPDAPEGLTVVSVGSGRVILRWDPNPDLDLRGYRVYRRDESAFAPTLLTASLLDGVTYDDTDSLVNETPYLYNVTAVDIGPPNALFADRESLPSSEVRGVPTAGEGSVGLCFVATAAYGTPWHPHVQSLRVFRDAHLRPSRLGRVFVAAYEHVSPPLAKVIARHNALRAAARAGLTPLVLAVEHPRATGHLAWLLLLGVCIVAVRRGKTSSS
jgi:subtilisin family serine protease